jgi:class 3 adenylate cyclase/tetratricopeptide (TPR) repeat protein
MTDNNSTCGRDRGSRLAGGRPNQSIRANPAGALPPEHHHTSQLERTEVAATRIAGERKQVTVLFVDIVGSTTLIRDLDIEDSVNLLDRVVAGMAAAIQAEGGTVLHLLGDGLEAVFGAPLAREDHAERACSAALRIRQSVRTHGVTLRIGINSGEVVVRSFVVGGKTFYDVGGMPVHLAARIEQVAAHGSIWISSGTASVVRRRFVVRGIGRRQVKGFKEPVEVFALLGRRTNAGSPQPWAAGRAGTLIGRTDELRHLSTILRRTASGSGVSVAVTGEAGIGKSCLLSELLKSRFFHGWTVVGANAEPTDARSGFGPFARMVRQWLAVGTFTSAADIWSTLIDSISNLKAFDERDFRAIAALLELPPNVAAKPIPPTDLRRSISQATIKLLHGWAASGPVLVLFEDVHWFDRDSEALLKRFLRHAGRLPVAIVFSYRSGYSRDPFGNLVQTVIKLAPLDDAEALRLFETKLGNHPSLRALQRQVVARSGGIPFFIEELINGLLETQVIKINHGCYVAGPSAWSLKLPATIQSLLSDRLDRLSVRDREMLRLISAIGQEAPLEMIARLLNCSTAEVEIDLSSLFSMGLLVRVNDGGEWQARFNHVLTQEAAYSSLLKESRRVIHERIFRTYETLYQDRIEEHVEILARHAREAALGSLAVDYLHRAAQKAVQLSRHSQAIVFIQEALAALAETNAGNEDVELELRLLLRIAFNAIGNYRARLPNLDRAQSLAERLGRISVVPEIMISRVSVLLQLGQARRALRISADLHRSAHLDADLGTAIIASYSYSRCLFYNGHVQQALTIATNTLDFLEINATAHRHGGAFGSTQVLLLTQISQAHACLGQSPDAISAGEAALRLAIAGKRNWDIELASYGLAIAHLYSGDLEVTASVLEHALVISELEESASSLVGMLTSLLGYAYVRSGRLQEGLEMCRRALEHREESYHHRNWSRLCCAALLREAGYAEQARSLAREASTQAKLWNYPVQAAWGEVLLAELLEGTDSVQALNHAKRALRISDRFQLQPLTTRAVAVRSRLESGPTGGSLRSVKARPYVPELAAGHWYGYAAPAASLISAVGAPK